MMHYVLPRLHPQLYEQLSVQRESTEHNTISHSLAFYLNDIKDILHNCPEEWDAYKKLTNTYEYIHSIVPTRKQCVSRLHPLSRSYYKMVEIVKCFHLLPDDRPLHSFHLAEGPGGFIQAVVDLRGSADKDTYFGMTLVVSDRHEDIPGWKKSRQFLRDHPNVVTETGADGTGNMLSLDNFEHVVTKFMGTMDLVTADGGFDFSADFSHQEANASELIFAQIAYAVCLQKKGGHFVLKVFDMFTKYTVDMVALLASLYEQVYVTKPVTSRCANSEKYIVCKGLLVDSAQVYPYLRDTLKNILAATEPSDVTGLLPNPLIPRAFINKIEEYNAILGQQQIDNIHQTLQLIYSSDRKRVPDDRRAVIQNMIRKNAFKCVQWCIKHDIPYDDIFPA
jgi:23S rRNA U2552 (ribose-2'-O)-methylase RlmE/FtsJ